MQNTFANGTMEVHVTGRADNFWSYAVKGSDKMYTITCPTFEIDGQYIVAELLDVRPLGVPQSLSNGSYEYCYVGQLRAIPHLTLVLTFRVALDNPVVRFAYTLKISSHDAVVHLTKRTGKDALCYLSVSLADLQQTKEVRFSNFNHLVHSYCMEEVVLEAGHFTQNMSVMGPLLCATNEQDALIVAYEHGSQVPDAFVQFAFTADRIVELQAVKGNYFAGQIIDGEHSYQTIWFQLGAMTGSEDEIAQAFRTFLLRYQSLQTESRKPYIFYNTWNFQERDKWWNKNKYLTSLYEEYVLREIDVAHRMGIDVFVIDTGWYIKTGDWRVNPERFSNDLKLIKARLDSYEMKLGLWFDPTAAALTSNIMQQHQGDRRSWHGSVIKPREIWETEQSNSMCLVSAYSDSFANELIRLAQELGVSYFKWDAIHQYGCDDPNHWHGTHENTAAERADCYAFQLIREMTRIVEKVTSAVPEAIVDFDVTEPDRAVGLSFLSAGKYFLINNGPYYQNYNIPRDGTIENTNLYFYPGPARTWVCRTPVIIDKWIPSILFLTHYFPDDPAPWQLVSIASLILGQNGIWGQLQNVAEDGVELIRTLLQHYKIVRDDVTASTLIQQGVVGGSPEIYEKISSTTGRGVIVIFATSPGEYKYVTKHSISTKYWHTTGVSLQVDAEGKAILSATFEKSTAHIVFFE